MKISVSKMGTNLTKIISYNLMTNEHEI